MELAGFFPLVLGGSVECLEAQSVVEKEKGQLVYIGCKVCYNLKITLNEF